MGGRHSAGSGNASENAANRPAGEDLRTSINSHHRVDPNVRGTAARTLGEPDDSGIGTRTLDSAAQTLGEPDNPGIGTLPSGASGASGASEPPAKSDPVKKRRRSWFRTFLSFVGELLITAGLVLLLFIVWQLWWTDVEVHRDQAVQQQEIVQDWSPEPSTTGTPRTDDPPVAAPVADGEPIGIIHIPRFGSDYAYTIKQGTEMSVLNQGAFGHYANTQGVGEVGNFALAAHRQTYGAPLRDVPELQEGDPIIIETGDAYYVYRVTEHYIVDPSEGDVVLPVPRQPGVEATERILTLTTCHPPFVSNQRWIVHATLDYWVPRSDGLPPDMVTD